jgi:hypothetical protein
MPPTRVWLSLAALAALPASACASVPARSWPAPASGPHAVPPPSRIVQGEGATAAEAEQNALAAGRGLVLDHLHRDGVPWVWEPTDDYLRRAGIVRLGEPERTASGYRVEALVGVTPAQRQRREMVGLDQEARTLGRLALLARVLAGLLALLAVAAAYLRLDEATKGYYTGRLRLAALALLGLAGFGLWLTL